MLFDPLFNCSNNCRHDIDRMQRGPCEIDDLVSCWRLMKVEACIVRVQVTIPSTFPVVCGRRFDVVYREVATRKPANIQSSGFDRRWIPTLLTQDAEDSGLVAVGIELG